MNDACKKGSLKNSFFWLVDDLSSYEKWSKCWYTNVNEDVARQKLGEKL